MASLIVCMAGLNTRFHDVGFDIPKYLLPWKKATIVHEILQQFTENYKFDQIYLLANKRDSYFINVLEETIKPLGLSRDNINYIGDTNGQAHTAFIGTNLIRNNDPVFVHNADTILCGRNIQTIVNDLKNGVDAFVDSFVATNPKYSYIQVDGNKVIKIEEKKAISPFASSGLYVFKNKDIYEKYYNNVLVNFTGKEMYIANILSQMIDDGLSVVTNTINYKEETIVLGSPQEYGIEMAKQVLMK